MKEIIEKLKNNLISHIEFRVADEVKQLFVVKEFSFQTAEGLRPYFKNEFLFLTKNELFDGSDVFPLEFLNIKNTYKLIKGKDVIAELNIKKEDIRRQLEFEVRSKLIHLREEYMSLRRTKELNKLIGSIIPAIIPMLEGLIYLRDKAKPLDIEEIFARVEDGYKVKTDILFELKNYNTDVWLPDKKKMKTYIKETMILLTELGEKLDKLKL